jgi:phosphate transport system substrate-binding protein
VKTVRHGSRARAAAIGLAATGAIFIAGCGAANETAAPPAAGGTGGEGAPSVSGTIAGAGASSQQAAMEAWIAGFTSANPDATINYDPSGSGAGREQFLGDAVAFAGSDAALKDEELATAQTRCGGADNVIELPVYVSPIAIIFKLDGVTELNLAPATIAQIFDRKITTWNDPAIAADNPGVTLPATAITPVNRSDESGTTQNFTDYLSKAAPEAWTYKPAGAWPVQGGEAAQGTSGVVGAVTGGNGTIGYADASQAGDLGVVKVKVGAEYVGPSAEAAAAVVAASERVSGRGEHNYAINLARDTTASGAYPVVLVSYDIACTQYPDQATADLVKGFLGYVISEDGQNAAAESAGSAPITAEQRSTYEPAVEAITVAG